MATSEVSQCQHDWTGGAIFPKYDTRRCLQAIEIERRMSCALTQAYCALRPLFLLPCRALALFVAIGRCGMRVRVAYSCLRNMHCGMLAGEQEEELLPYVEDDAALLEACGYGAAFESRRNLASVAWPSSARTGAAAGLVAQAGSGSGAVSVRSLDRCVCERARALWKARSE